jgi:hypothetical protein
MTMKLWRGTRANLNLIAAANGLNVGQPGLLIDEARHFICLTASTYQTFAKSSEVLTPRQALWAAPGNTATIVASDASALTILGTATGANSVSTNAYTWMRRIETLVTVASATAIAGVRAPSALWGIGNGAGLGGFDMVFDWGPATGVATTTNRAFVGAAASVAAPTDVEPSTLLNMIGMGWDAADTNIQIMRNAGAGLATKIDLGVNFPVPIVDRSKAYRLRLRADPNSTSVFYEVRDFGADKASSGIINTNLPAPGTLLAPRGHLSAGGTSSIIGFAFGQCKMISDF